MATKIGMGDKHLLGDRNGVRTPDEWSPDRNAGFSRGDPQRLYLPRSWIRYTATRRSTSRRKAAALVAVELDAPPDRDARRHSLQPRLLHVAGAGQPQVLAFIREHELPGAVRGDLARTSQAVELDLARFRNTCRSRCWAASRSRLSAACLLLTLPATGYFAFRLDPRRAARVARGEAARPSFAGARAGATWQAALAAK